MCPRRPIGSQVLQGSQALDRLAQARQVHRFLEEIAGAILEQVAGKVLSTLSQRVADANGLTETQARLIRDLEKKLEDDDEDEDDDEYDEDEIYVEQA